MSNYVERCVELCKMKNPGEPEFHQAVEEVLYSLQPVLDMHPEYESAGILERMIEPDRGITFRVAWTDDAGKVHVNRGFRYQFNSALGPYKGGIRFSPTVSASVMKFLGFEQVLKNSLTGLPIGGGKGGADFDPVGKSDSEIMRFCQAFMTELYRHIGPDTDIPAGDLGVGAKEIGYMFGQYKRIVNRFEGALTGKGLDWGGLFGRNEATGYGVVYMTKFMIEANGESMAGKRVALSGFGNVAWGAAEKLNEIGAKVVTISGPDGYILDEDGISGEKVDYMVEMRNSGANVCKTYVDKFPEAKFFAGKKPWEAKADIMIPCATQNEILLEDAKKILANGCKFVVEGSNMGCANEAISFFHDNNVLMAPSKAANAGGVACSCIEMGQNSGKTVFEADIVHELLFKIMKRIHDDSAAASMKYFGKYDLVGGANIVGFTKVADSMVAQGTI